jgi:hypothetical protein
MNNLGMGVGVMALLCTNRMLDNMIADKPIRLSGKPTTLMRRAKLLPERDRLLVELAVDSRLSRRKLARVFNRPPGSLIRRLHRLSARLYDPLVVDLTDPDCPLEPEQRQIGLEFYLLRLPARKIAARHGMKTYQVRRQLSYLKGWHGGLRASRPRVTRA